MGTHFNSASFSSDARTWRAFASAASSSKNPFGTACGTAAVGAGSPCGWSGSAATSVDAVAAPPSKKSAGSSDAVAAAAPPDVEPDPAPDAVPDAAWLPLPAPASLLLSLSLSYAPASKLLPPPFADAEEAGATVEDAEARCCCCGGARCVCFGCCCRCFCCCCCCNCRSLIARMVCTHPIAPMQNSSTTTCQLKGPPREDSSTRRHGDMYTCMHNGAPVRGEPTCSVEPTGHPNRGSHGTLCRPGGQHCCTLPAAT